MQKSILFTRALKSQCTRAKKSALVCTNTTKSLHSCPSAEPPVHSCSDLVVFVHTRADFYCTRALRSQCTSAQNRYFILLINKECFDQA